MYMNLFNQITNDGHFQSLIIINCEIMIMCIAMLLCICVDIFAR